MYIATPVLLCIYKNQHYYYVLTFGTAYYGTKALNCYLILIAFSVINEKSLFLGDTSGISEFLID